MFVKQQVDRLQLLRIVRKNHSVFGGLAFIQTRTVILQHALFIVRATAKVVL